MAHQGIRNGWLSDNYCLIEQPLFKPLIRKNIVFYDSCQNVLKPTVAKAKRKEARKRERIETKDLLERLRGFELADY